MASRRSTPVVTRSIDTGYATSVIVLAATSMPAGVIVMGNSFEECATPRYLATRRKPQSGPLIEPVVKRHDAIGHVLPRTGIRSRRTHRCEASSRSRWRSCRSLGPFAETEDLLRRTSRVLGRMAEQHVDAVEDDAPRADLLRFRVDDGQQTDEVELTGQLDALWICASTSQCDASSVRGRPHPTVKPAVLGISRSALSSNATRIPGSPPWTSPFARDLQRHTKPKIVLLAPAPPWTRR